MIPAIVFLVALAILPSQSLAANWMVEAAPDGAGSTNNRLTSVSCPSQSACFASGFLVAPWGTSYAYTESWDGENWSLQSPAENAGTQLQGISCVSATDCTAVGGRTAAGGEVTTVAWHWNGAAWSNQTTPNGPGSTNNRLTSVSCPAQNSCFAAGYLTDAVGTDYGYTERWNGTSWSLQSPPENLGTQLRGISCVSTTDCTAVGSRTAASGEISTVAWHWNGTAWSIQTTPNGPGSTNNRLTSVSCPAQNSCFAAGYLLASWGTYYGSTERWNGTSWSLQSPPENAGTQLQGISCSSSSKCVAVGSHTASSGAVTTVAWHWDGTQWSIDKTTDPGETGARLAAVSCTLGCTTVGSSAVAPASTSTLVEHTLAETLTPMGWDYDLTKECVQTTGLPGEVNYFEDTESPECTNPADEHWLAVLQSEKGPNSVCGNGVTNRAFDLSDPESPVKMNWSEGPGNRVVNLKVDQVTPSEKTCGPEYFTFASLMEHSGYEEIKGPNGEIIEVDMGGGPFPDARSLVTSHTISYQQYRPGSTAKTRLIVGAQAAWGEKAHILEINLDCNPCLDGEPEVPSLLLLNHDWWGNGKAEFAVLDAPWWGFGVPADGSSHDVEIPWGYLFKYAAAEGWFGPIPSGPAAVEAVYNGVEVQGEAIADLYTTNFRVAAE